MKLINNAVKKFIRFSDITSDKIKSTAIIPIEDLKKLNEINKSYKCIIRIEKIISFKFRVYRFLNKYFFC